MNLTKLNQIKPDPNNLFVVIEIPMGSTIKYELDKDLETLVVDRFAFTTMGYPLNYGFVPGTHADDGDALDVLVLASHPIQPGCAIRCRVVGMLEMEDEAGIDTKIIAVPLPKVDPFYANVNDIGDISDAIKNKVKHFFEHYKDLEPGKWVKLKEWKGKKSAEEAVRRAIA